MVIYTIKFNTSREVIYDTINIGIVIYDSDVKPHVLISYEKLERIKNFVDDRVYTNVKFMLDIFLDGANNGEVPLEKIEDYFAYYDIVILNKVNWLTHLSENKFEDKFEMYEFFFKKFIYNNIRADKLRKLMNEHEK